MLSRLFFARQVSAEGTSSTKITEQVMCHAYIERHRVLEPEWAFFVKYLKKMCLCEHPSCVVSTRNLLEVVKKSENLHSEFPPTPPSRLVYLSMGAHTGKNLPSPLCHHERKLLRAYMRNVSKRFVCPTRDCPGCAEMRFSIDFVNDFCVTQ